MRTEADISRLPVIQQRHASHRSSSIQQRPTTLPVLKRQRIRTPKFCSDQPISTLRHNVVDSALIPQSSSHTKHPRMSSHPPVDTIASLPDRNDETPSTPSEKGTLGKQDALAVCEDVSMPLEPKQALKAKQSDAFTILAAGSALVSGA